MLFELKPPFTNLWRKAYLRSQPNGRKLLDLFNTNDDRTTISYARYLVSVREGRFLTNQEEVDHDDNDCTNDADSNLILRTVEEHLVKTLKARKPKTVLSFVCPVCRITFQRRKGLEGKNRIPKCSRRCNGIARTTTPL